MEQTCYLYQEWTQLERSTLLLLLLLPSFAQMAGRAGRRGLDSVGTVLLVGWDEPPPESDIRLLLTGKGVALTSQFRLTYNMILNLLRVEDLKVGAGGARQCRCTFRVICSMYVLLAILKIGSQFLVFRSGSVYRLLS